jgi:GGDEF domain-containing protein
VIHVDILNWDAYADAIGIARSEDTVKNLGQWLLDAARKASGGGAFIGHIGGSDFISILAPDQSGVFIDQAESAFDDHKATLPGDASTLALVLAVTDTDGLKLATGADELGRRLGKAMKAAKAAGKTGHVKYTG